MDQSLESGQDASSIVSFWYCYFISVFLFLGLELGIEIHHSRKVRLGWRREDYIFSEVAMREPVGLISACWARLGGKGEKEDGTDSPIKVTTSLLRT